MTTVVDETTNPDPDRDTVFEAGARAAASTAGRGGPTDPPRDWRSLLVRTRFGRAIAAVGVALAAVAIVFPNLGDSALRQRFEWVWEPTTELGFSQNWGVFAPNPRGTSFEVVAEVELADGTRVEWELPDHEPVLGAYREYRWQKWQERFRRDSSQRLWGPVADWVAAKYDDAAGGPAVRVSFTRRWMDHTPLGEGSFGDDTWEEFCFYGCEDP